MTEPTLTPASMTSVPLEMPAALVNRASIGVAGAEQAAVEEEDGQDARGHHDDRRDADDLGVAFGDGLHFEPPVAAAHH